MPTKVVVRLDGRVVGRFHGPPATHVAVIVLRNGRIQCRGWGLRTDAEAALARAKQHEQRLQHAAVHETEPDDDGTGPVMRRLPRPEPRPGSPGAPRAY